MRLAEREIGVKLVGPHQVFQYRDLGYFIIREGGQFLCWPSANPSLARPTAVAPAYRRPASLVAACHAARVVNAVSAASGFSVEDLQGERKFSPLAHTRQLAALIMRDVFDIQQSRIAHRLNRDDSTIRYSTRRARRRLRDRDETTVTIYRKALAILGVRIDPSSINQETNL